MPHYKTTSGNIHYIDSPDFEHLLPDGCVQISDDEARAMLSALIPTPTAAAELVRQQISELESQQTGRRIREAVLGIDGGWLLNINNEINFLRNRLKELS